MTTLSALFDPQLLQRYDVPGPRYTSYPTAPQFSAGFGEAQLREVAAASNGDPIPRPISLYLHISFCTSPCFYCGCNRIITRDKTRGEAYLTRLYREIALANGHADWAGQIRATFAQQWIERAKAGWYYQDSNSLWQRK